MDKARHLVEAHGGSGARLATLPPARRTSQPDAQARRVLSSRRVSGVGAALQMPAFVQARNAAGDCASDRGAARGALGLGPLRRRRDDRLAPRSRQVAVRHARPHGLVVASSLATAGRREASARSASAFLSKVLYASAPSSLAISTTSFSGWRSRPSSRYPRLLWNASDASFAGSRLTSQTMRWNAAAARSISS